MDSMTTGLAQGRVQSCVDMDHLSPALLGPHSEKWSSGVAATRISGCFLRVITRMADAVGEWVAWCR